MNALKGAFTALITPFTADNELDEEGLRFLIRRQLENGIDGISPVGTTGEAPTLTEKEVRRIIQIAKEEISDQAVFMVGTGSYNTRKAIENTLQAQEMGVDMALIVTPYYNRPTQEGLYQHFKAIAEASTLPIVIYNIQGRTGQNLHTDTLKRLLDIPTIIGLKEASGNISQINDVIELVRQCRPEFSVMSGDDALTFPLMALGGNGIVSVLSNLLPKEIKSLTQAVQDGNWTLARELHYQLMPLIKGVFLETNPIPIKAAMHRCELPAGGCRLPLCPLSPENAAKLDQLLESFAGKTQTGFAGYKR